MAFSLRDDLGTPEKLKSFIDNLKRKDVEDLVSQNAEEIRRTYLCLDFFHRLLQVDEFSCGGNSAELYALVSLFLARQGRLLRDPNSPTKLAHWYMMHLGNHRDAQRQTPFRRQFFEVTRQTRDFAPNQNAFAIAKRKELLLDLWKKSPPPLIL